MEIWLKLGYNSLMRVAIDVSQVVYGTGVAEYTKLLLRNLSRIDAENEYVLFGGSLRRGEYLKNVISSLALGPRFQLKQFLIPPTLSDFMWNRLHLLPIEKLIGKVDVFHSSDWSQPPSSAFKVTTVHDLAPILFPNLTPRKIVHTHLVKLTRVKEEVDRIIVPSNATRMDLIKFGVDESKIRVIPEAPSEIFNEQSSEEIERVKRKYGIRGKYLLGVGINARKNTRRIVEAFSKIRTGELKLVLIGNPQVTLGETRGISLLGFVPDADRPALYSGAEGLLYPSLYEGFGLPILEAFACGCPVLTSNRSSMEEVAGGAATLVDPDDVLSIAEGIKYLLEHKKTLQKKGFVEVKKYSWEETAKKTLEVYSEGRFPNAEVSGGVQNI